METKRSGVKKKETEMQMEQLWEGLADGFLLLSIQYLSIVICLHTGKIISNLFYLHSILLFVNVTLPLVDMSVFHSSVSMYPTYCTFSYRTQKHNCAVRQDDKIKSLLKLILCNSSFSTCI